MQNPHRSMIGRPSIRALDAGLELPFGEWGREGERFELALG